MASEGPDGLTRALVVVLVACLVLAAGPGFIGTATADRPPAYEHRIPNDGDPHSVGFPLPVKGRLADMFPEGTAGVEAVFKYTSQGWVHVTDFQNVSFSPREAIVLTTSGDSPDNITMRIEFQNNTNFGGDFGEYNAHEGWNFLAPNNFTPAQSFIGGTLNGPLIAVDQFAPVLSPEYDGPDRFNYYVNGSYRYSSHPYTNAFGGYFMYTTKAVNLPWFVPEINNKTDTNEFFDVNGRWSEN